MSKDVETRSTGEGMNSLEEIERKIRENNKDLDIALHDFLRYVSSDDFNFENPDYKKMKKGLLKRYSEVNKNE